MDVRFVRSDVVGGSTRRGGENGAKMLYLYVECRERDIVKNWRRKVNRGINSLDEVWFN